MAKRVAIVQSNYIPWKGYFDLIASVDEFILYDDMQYTRRDWRNRNQIKTADGRQWLTVPVKVTGRYHQRIRETEIDGEEWAAQHWKSLRHAYGRASNFRTEAPWVEQLYLEKSVSLLSSLNRRWIEAICRKLEIQTRISNSWDYPLSEGKSERLANLCLQAGASTYVSGPAARDYLVDSVFEERGVQVEWFSYENYPEYPQLWGAFEHGVTILDLIFNCGAESRRHMLLARR